MYYLGWSTSGFMVSQALSTPHDPEVGPRPIQCVCFPKSSLRTGISHFQHTDHRAHDARNRFNEPSSHREFVANLDRCMWGIL